MGFCTCDKATGAVKAWEANAQDRPVNPATEVVVKVAASPDVRTQRWDGATGLRAATAQEVASFDAALVDREAQGRIDDQLLKAVIIFLVQRLNELRTQPTTALPALTAQAVRDGIVAIYKTL